MIDERFASSVSAWLRRTDDASPNTEANVGQAMAQIHRTRQHRRWLWFLPGTKPTAGATRRNGRAQPPQELEIDGGTRPMFSNTKMVGLAAVMALLGGLTLALPIGAPETAPDPAVTSIETGEISRFTGTVHVLDQDAMADAEHFDWGAAKLGEQWTMRWEMSDPRISGITTLFNNVHELGPAKRRVMAHTGRLFTSGADGAWLESGLAYQDPETTGIHMQIRSVGEGAYEGLVAISDCDQETFSDRFDCEGAILGVSPPEPPAEPPQEVPARYGEP